jgi:hypothetical protein
MIQDFKLKKTDFELSFEFIRSLFNKESESIKIQYTRDQTVNLFDYYNYKLNSLELNNIELCYFSIYPSNIIETTYSKHTVFNKYLLNILTQYEQIIGSSPNKLMTLHMLSQELVCKPSFFYNRFDHSFSYTEFDLYKRLLVLESLHLLKKNEYSMKLLNLLKKEYGSCLITTDDLIRVNLDIKTLIAA